MGFKEVSEALNIPEGFSLHSLINPPTFRYLNTCDHQAEPAFVTTEEGQSYLITLRTCVGISEIHRLFKGSFRLAGQRREETGGEDPGFLFVLDNGNDLHEADIWIQNQK